jgi:hypothetical protein
MTRRSKFSLFLLLIACNILYGQNVKNDKPGLQINIWHGLHQKVGHIGHAQNDFNLLGNITNPETLVSLSYSLNDAPPVELSAGRGKFGDTRRLASPGDFNADIAISSLRKGKNIIVVKAIDSMGRNNSVTASVERLNGNYPLPVNIDWGKIRDPQDVGQYVDGKWALEKEGLRTEETGYDRVFLIGDTTWKDYEVIVTFIFHRADRQTGPVSGGNGLGILMRFAGHVTGGHRNFPDGQPKWGYQPFGSIGLLRWEDGPEKDPTIQFFRGDNDQTWNFGTISLVPGNHYTMKMRCVTLPDAGIEGVTRYSFKIWKAKEPEPGQWNFEVDQQSRYALRYGGMVPLAHHVDVTFGPIQVVQVK